MGSLDKRFSVASFFTVVSEGSLVCSPETRLWSPEVPPRVVAFGWLALQGKILAMDNLWVTRKLW